MIDNKIIQITKTDIENMLKEDVIYWDERDKTLKMNMPKKMEVVTQFGVTRVRNGLITTEIFEGK
jgi:hypothetical protein